MKARTMALALCLAAPTVAIAAEPSPADYAADAHSLGELIAANYAYLDHLPGGSVPTSPYLAAERDGVHDKDSLLRYAEDMITALADHHAITTRSFKDDWALVPSYADLWIVRRSDAYVIDAVKPGTPAAAAGIRKGDRLAAVDGQPIDTAVAAFWSRIGLQAVGERTDYAARVLAAGRRDRARHLTIAGANGTRDVTLASLYGPHPDQAPVTVTPGARGDTTIRINNALGDNATIVAFDAAMTKLSPRARVTIDLTDTPSGGNTTVARAMLGWFVAKPMPYQMHNLPAEERETGIARQWVELVLPRAGKYHPGGVTVRVGRWTGSLGEGLAIGFAAIGGHVCGTPMAGLKGAVYDFDLPRTGLRVKFPAERLYTVAGQPRETVVPPPCRD